MRNPTAIFETRTVPQGFIAALTHPLFKAFVR